MTFPAPTPLYLAEKYRTVKKSRSPSQCLTSMRLYSDVDVTNEGPEASAALGYQNSDGSERPYSLLLKAS